MNKIIKITFAIIIILGASNSFAQEQERPVKWTASVERTKPDSATLVFTAAIEKEWHIYSQFTPDGGPIPTAFTYPKPTTPSNYLLVGKTTEPKADEAYDKDFGLKILTLQGTPIFRQQVAVRAKQKVVIPEIGREHV